MHARRAILPIVLLSVWICLYFTPRVGTGRAPIAEDMPQAPGVLALPEAQTPQTIEELKQQLATTLQREHIPGVAIALVGRDGPIWVGGVGVRDRATGAAMDADTAFRVGSLSKSIVALGVMRLADQGKLDIDRPLREILPDAGLDNPWESVAPVTLAQCLEHTAGLDDVRFNEIFTTDEQLSVREALALNPRSRKVRWRPGTRHAYSNVGYTLAARAIEVVTGEPFDVYLRREILTPLGIRDSDFQRTAVLAPRLATGYIDDDHTAEFHAFAHRPSASLLASANDLGKLVQFFLSRGEGFPPILSRAAIARIERSGTLPYPHVDGDYGFANYGDVQHPVFARGHDGGMPGFHASFRYFPELGVGYVMLLNSNYTFRGYFQIRALLYSYLTRGMTVPAVSRGAAAPPDRPGADYFALANPRNEVFGFIEQAFYGWEVAEVEGGVRIGELGGPSLDFVPVADGGYRRPSECGSTLRFATSVDGAPVMVTGFGYGEAAPGWVARVRRHVLLVAFRLLAFAPVWSGVVLGLFAITRRRGLPLAFTVWPAVAGLCCFALPRLIEPAFHRGVIGDVHPYTVAICALSILFAVSSVATLYSVVRWYYRRDRPRLRSFVLPAAYGVAFTGLTLWAAAHGLIGLRTWAW